MSSVKITWGSLAIATPSARSCSTVRSDIVDAQVDQGARCAAFEQQPGVAEPEERQARRIEDGDRRLTEQPAVERDRPIEILDVLGDLVQDHGATSGTAETDCAR